MAVTDEPHIQTLNRYLELLEEDKYEESAGKFTEDAVYYHSPMFQEDIRVGGRDNIQSYFKKRGHQNIDHEIVKSVANGDKAGIVGRITGTDVNGDEDYFVSFAEFEDDKIAYYIAGLLYG